VAAGGDGTINEVINGLIGTETALAALPIGTVNVWVRELGFPLQPRAAAEAMLKARVERIDLGRAGNRYFLLMASVGFDAAVTATVRAEAKRRLGVFAYVLQVLTIARRWRGTRVQMLVDGKPRRGRMLMVVLGNSQLYGGFVKLTARASLNDGLLDVVVIRGKSLRSVPLRYLAVLTRRYDLDPGIEYHRAHSVRIEGPGALPVQVDGDHIGDTPMLFEAVPGALLALLPPTLRDDDLLRDLPLVPQTTRTGVFSWFGRQRGPRARRRVAG
jgi:YegS/Rv2252/BmrU family lipid kinase